MFRRKLIALEFQKPDSFDVNDEGQFRNMIVWLEDQKIRHYKIEDRAGLRNISSSDWSKSFEAVCWKAGKAQKIAVYNLLQYLPLYLGDLNCPYQLAERQKLMDWILGFAVRLEYGDNVDKYSGVTPESLQQTLQGKSEITPGASTNPLDNLNFDDPDFKVGVSSLALLLQIPPHPDHLQQLKAICILVKEKLSKEALEKAEKQKNVKDEHIPLEKTELGFDTGDYILNDAAKVLRLLHVRDLRELQTQINQAIVRVQTVTANPKTDSRLGKVGR